MVKHLMKINEHENQVINFVIAKHKLKNKNEAISLIINDYKKKYLK